MDLINSGFMKEWKGFVWLLFALTCGYVSSEWDKWWSYDGINGPNYWGTANPDWKLCKRGRQQSPINIEPTRLLFDPNLKHLKINSTTVRGTLKTNERGITLDIINDGSSIVNISLGPLSYTYRVSEIKFHLANNDNVGSEHKVSGKSFPVEMHMIAYNSDLYKNISEASKGVKGLAIVAVFMEIGTGDDKFISHITRVLKTARDKTLGTEIYIKEDIHEIHLSHVITKTSEYVTYEGSLTQPGCYETVTWILLNKPIWIDKDQLSELRIIFNSRANEPDLPLQSNIRPVMQLNHRVSKLCTFDKDMFYQVNTRFNRT